MRMPMGFSKEPDFGLVLVFAGIVAAVGYALYAYEGPLWQRLLVAPGVLLALIVGGVIAGLLIAGVFWIFFLVMRQLRKDRLQHLLRLEDEAAPREAIEQAQAICESFNITDRDLFRRSPALCLQFVDAARRGGLLQRFYLRALMDNAPWSRDVESAIYEGRRALAQQDLWHWLYWLRNELPADDPAASDRLAAALEFCLAQGNAFHRRGSWADCLERVRDSEPWRRLAAQCRDDLVALLEERRERLNPREREALELLLRGMGPG